ncbi:MAG: FAD-dependent oxidoreductase [Oligoflexia bacterium]|nr:FAD-dependent oxidoreductase [Oligoflexia bacterium]
MLQVKTVIIGAGIIGTSIAKSLIDNKDNNNDNNNDNDIDLAIFEQENFIGHHTSSRNSGVIHAGLYYEKDSLKHRLCIEGNHLWDQWTHELNVPLNRCGKFIIASTEEEAIRFDNLFLKAKNNGTDVRLATAKEIKELQEYVIVKKAFFSPNTAIIETSTLLKSIADFLYKKNIALMLKNKVLKIVRLDIESQRDKNHNNRFYVETERESFYCRNLINAAGCFAVDLRKQLALIELEKMWVKGNYLATNQQFYKKHLIYPVPPIDEKILGVHSTFDHAGILRFGPDAEDTDEINYHVYDSIIEKMWPQIKIRFKNIDYKQLHPDYCGIRPQIKFNQKKYNDFWIKNFDGYIELCGIESPGLTAAPAIANYIRKLIS